MSAYRPAETFSRWTPTRSRASRTTCFPANTPIDPVIVPALASTRPAGIAMK